MGYSQVHKTWSRSFLIKDFLFKVANLIVVETVTGRLRWRLVLIEKLCWLSAQSHRDLKNKFQVFNDYFMIPVFLERSQDIRPLTVETRCNEGPRDWHNLFAIPRFRHMEHIHMLYYYWGKENRSLYRGLRYIEVRYIDNFVMERFVIPRTSL